jgi:hypothetical protein
MVLDHGLHKRVGQILNDAIVDVQDVNVLLDEACGGKQRIPLWANNVPLCCVDCAVELEGEIILIVEIEETDIKPTKIFGKFMTSAMAEEYRRGSKKPIKISEHTSFLQVIKYSKSNTNRHSLKPSQLISMESSIQELAKKKNSKIKVVQYKLVRHSDENFEHDIKDYVKKALSNVSR